MHVKRRSIIRRSILLSSIFIVYAPQLELLFYPFIFYIIVVVVESRDDEKYIHVKKYA